MLTLGAQLKILSVLILMSNNKVIRLNRTNVMWNGVNWAKVQAYVRRVQNRIYKARKKGDITLVHELQQLLVKSKAAKLLAVRQVTTLNKGKKTAGVDKQIVTTVVQKSRLVRRLSLDGEALPIRRVWIPKPGKAEKRPLGIPSILDRAKQSLAKLALEPEWEAIFEPNSYGFRPGRRAHDAIEAIFLGLRHNTPKWVFDADIRKCFDEIDHSALLKKLNTYPAMERQIAAWLKAGIMEGYANTPKDYESATHNTKGTPQGGTISPLLANIALHGLENHLSDFVAKLPIKPHPDANRGATAKRKALTVVRYADDFVLIHRNKEIMDLCIEETKRWLTHIGLQIQIQISEEKSKLRDGRNGFNFLGFQIIQVMKPRVGNYKVKIQPARKSQERILEKIRNIIQNHRSVSSYDLIAMLRPVIIGWANYYKYCECKNVFHKLTHLIFQKIRAWVFRRDTRNGRLKVKGNYFPSGREYVFDGSRHQDNWILVGQKKFKKGIVKKNFLPHMVWVKSIKHVKVLDTQSPYSLDIYWAMRSAKHSPYPLRIRTLLVRQKQSCPICKQKFTNADAETWEVDHIIPRSQGGLDRYNNLQLLHKECHIVKTRKDMEASKDKVDK